jgi:transcriptional regulator with XRE-family HTH domain
MVDKLHSENGSPGRKEFLATAEKPFHFVDCGLDNVYLVGIRYFEEPDGRILAEIPAVKHLMQMIACDVVSSPLDLTGDEIRFLRKRLGKKAAEYCRYLGIEPETLSRIENGKQPISSQVQKLARLSYCVFSEDPKLIASARDIFQSMLEDISQKNRGREKIVLEMDPNDLEWRESRAAA